MSSHKDPISDELYQLAGYVNELQIESIKLSPIDFISDNVNAKINSGYSCIFDWSSMRYMFMSASVINILGYNSEAFLDKGFNFTLSIIHSEDILKLKKLHLAIFNYFYSIPTAQRAKLRFSYNLRVKTASDDFVHILRQSIFTEFTPDGKPKIEYVNSTDITGFKYSNCINLTIHQLSDSGIYMLCHEQEFSEVQTNLTEREKQVLKLVRCGYTTKEIANHLFVAVETIKSHRKHIIAKTGTCNMTAAINMVVNKISLLK